MGGEQIIVSVCSIAYWKNSACNTSVTCKYQADTCRMFTAYYYPSYMQVSCNMQGFGVILHMLHACNKHVQYINMHVKFIHCIYMHWPCTVHALAMHCTCIGHALHMHWPCTAHALAMHCTCVGHALHMRWPCTAHALAMHCTCVGHALHMHCICIGHALHMHWPCTAHALAMHCTYADLT